MQVVPDGLLPGRLGVWHNVKIGEAGVERSKGNCVPTSVSAGHLQIARGFSE
jgi:hypothetical protein